MRDSGRTAMMLTAVLATVGAVTMGSGEAQAQSWIRRPGQHDSSVEVEVHGIIGYHWGGYGYGYVSPGAGVRIGIPIMRNGFVPSINNSVAINFGADVLFWPGADCNGGPCNVGVAIQAPVTLQWSFMLHERFSLFAEAGFAPTFGLYNGYYAGCGNQFFWCYLTPALAIGGRWHWRGGSQFPTLTFRVGFPVGATIGVSF